MALRPGRVVLSSLAPEKPKKRVHEKHYSTSQAPTPRGKKSDRPATPKATRPRPEPGSIEEAIAMHRKAAANLAGWAKATPAQLAAAQKLFRHPKTRAYDAAREEALA